MALKGNKECVWCIIELKYDMRLPDHTCDGRG